MRRSPARISTLCSLLLIAGSVESLAADREQVAFFETKIRPILVSRCNECHSAEAKIKGGLRLTSREAILKGGDSGPAAVPGKPAESLLVEVLRYVDEPRMPPKGKLSDSDRDLMSRWVEMGLPWPEEKKVVEAPKGERPPFQITAEQRKFWSFQPVKVIPPGPVRRSELAQTPIDRYLQSALEAKQIPPSPAADQLTLLRRVTYDLTGLPPTADEVKAFLSDRRPDAFAQVVERLLASPRYGEKWGRHWLDLVRYADSRDSRGVGSESDILESWHYRDYVVSAFNRDLPFDRFVREQVAGDLLQPASPDQVDVDAMVATGLLTIGEWGTGDADKEKMMADIVADQIDVVGRAFLGLTLGCARCHDHKFDPISQDDYYGLSGIFFSTHILPDPGAKTNGSPMLKTPLASKSAIAAAERYRIRLAQLEGERAKLATEASEAYAQSQVKRTAEYLVAAWDHQLGKEKGRTYEEVATGRGLNKGILRRWVATLGLGNSGTLLLRPMDRVLGTPGVYAWTGPQDTPSLSVNQNSQPVQILTFILPPRSVNLHPSPNKPVALTWTAPAPGGEFRIVGGVTDGDPACGDGIGWRIEHRKNGIWTTLASGEIPNGGSAEFAQGDPTKNLEKTRVEAGDLLRLAILPKGDHSCDTTAVRFRVESKQEVWDAAKDLVPDLLANGKGNPHADGKGRADVWSAVELSDTASTFAFDRLAACSTWKKAIGATPVDRPTIEKAAHALAAELASEPAKPLVAKLIAPGGPLRVEGAELPDEARRAFAPIDAELAQLRSKPPEAIPVGLVAQDGGVPKSGYEGFHEARIHIRGEYQRLGKVVPRHFPAIMAGEAKPAIPEKTSGRKELAAWLAQPQNPLTARVMVNRIWQFHFGEGLVRTPSNFGKLGERPSHPELLDYLADRFVRSGWSIKAMHREMLLTAAYQRSSIPTPEAKRLDPDNLLLSRMSRRRLTSEELRDSLLAASGKLDLRGGGPADREFSIPRRTLYQITIRSDRSSFGPLFDAADSTALVDKRAVSTVAPQALFLLNHPFVVQQAEALADRLIGAEKESDPGIQEIYRRLFGRAPTKEEAEIGRDLLAREGGPNDRSAWVAYAQVLLCSNEFVFVD